MADDPQLPLTDVQWVLGHAHLTTTQMYLTPTQGRGRRRRCWPTTPARLGDVMTRHHPAPGYDPQSLAVLFGRTCHDSVEHTARTRPAVANAAAAAQAQARNSQLRARFPARAVPRVLAGAPRDRWRTRRDG